MKRLNDKELHRRIHNFLARKTQEFPELGQGIALFDEQPEINQTESNQTVSRPGRRLHLPWHTTRAGGAVTR